MSVVEALTTVTVMIRVRETLVITAMAIIQKIKTFLDNCLRRNPKIRWPEIIGNEELWRKTGDNDRR